MKKRGKKEKKKEKKKKEKKNSLNTKGSMEEMPLCRWSVISACNSKN